jgi:hypothetical protein
MLVFPFVLEAIEIPETAHLAYVQVVYHNRLPTDGSGFPSMSGRVVEAVPVVHEYRAWSILLYVASYRHIVKGI